MDLRLFFSWQSDTKSKKLDNKTFLIECIKKAIDNVRKNTKGIQIEFQEGVSKTPGTPNIIDVNKDRIAKCHIYIADFTFTNHISPIILAWRRLRGKKLGLNINPNVLMEYIRADSRKGFNSQIITVMNTINGDPHKYKDSFPIDIQGNRFPITYNLASTKRKSTKEYKTTRDKLIKELTNAIELCAGKAKSMLDDDILPFISHEKHLKLSDFKGKYVWDGFESYKDTILKNNDYLRIIGLSGLGKTRLVLESFRDSENSHRYAYLNCFLEKEDKLKSKLQFMSDHYPQLVLILDNCDYELNTQILKYKEARRLQNPIITIFNNPDEPNDSSYKLIRLEKSFFTVVETILSRYTAFYNENDIEKLTQFADGMPMMAQLLGEGLQKGGFIGEIRDSTLLNKVLGTDENSEQRVIMRSLSLFDFIGYEGDKHKEMEFIAINKCITSLSGDSNVLIQEFDKVIENLLRRKIMERKGRLVGIRPTPIALYLIGEWLAECSGNRIYNVIDSIQKSELSKQLTQAFTNQFKNMGFNEKAQQLLNALMSSTSPFMSAEVVNTDLGSRLFCAFAEVNPVAVAEGLWRILGSKTTQELFLLEKGRRNIVWALDKVCFDSRSFEKGARLMLMLGIAENETYANNAHSQFVGLFPVYLPATETPLDVRLNFLRQMMTIEEYKSIVLDAISKALYIHDFFLMGGAEQQGTKSLRPYQPKTNDEILSYLKGCLDLLMDEILKDTVFKEKCLSILKSSFIPLWNFGLADLALRYTEETCTILNNNWDSMLDTLYLIDNHQDVKITNGYKNRIDVLISKLRKTDVVSRFRDISKANEWDGVTPYEESLKAIELKYSDIAAEIAKKKMYDIETLNKILVSENSRSQSFGSTLADSLNDEEQLEVANNFIKAIPRTPYPNRQILVIYLCSVKNDVFDKIFDLIIHQEKYDIAFSCVAARSLPIGDTKSNTLFQLIGNGNVGIENFEQYWSWFDINKYTDSDVVTLFSKLESLPGSFQTILHMSMRLTFSKNQNRFPRTIKTIHNTVLKFAKSSEPFVSTSDFWHIINFFLKQKHDPELARTLNKKIINYLNESHTYNRDYGIEAFYTVLIEDYFDESWNDISIALVGEGSSSYSLQFILGASIGAVNGETGLLFKSDHTEQFMTWCGKYPETAPAILMKMIPLGTNEEFPELVITILNKYSDKENVLRALSANLGTFIWAGSVVPLYMNQKKAIEKLINNEHEVVRTWATKMIAEYEQRIENAMTFEAEDR